MSLPTSWVVTKFGGTSVSSLDDWRTIRHIVDRRRAEGFRVLVVCSALSQVSNQLEGLLDAAESGQDLAPGLTRLRDSHWRLGKDMGLDVEALVADDLDELEQVLSGIAMTRESTPRMRARVLATGEFLSTRLGAAWLRAQGVSTAWRDARTMLPATTVPLSVRADERQYLSATCPDDRDVQLSNDLDATGAEVVVTQGFIAGGPDGDVVLLGRGGSDVSASYLAARLGATRIEIWTDTPGLFTANPRLVGDARQLRALTYDEASELAARGAKVLHPRCLQPASRYGIPLHVNATAMPDIEGTVIGPGVHHRRPGILGVVARKHLVLVHVDLDGTWQRVGTIAEVAGVFRDLGVPIDLLASSPSHVTVALDPAGARLDDRVLATLVAKTREIGVSRVDAPVASVSLVGTSIADVLHELGPLLELFEHEHIRLVSHAANDLSLTVVVDQESADPLVAALHARLLATHGPDQGLGPSWHEIMGATTTGTSPSTSETEPR